MPLGRQPFAVGIDQFPSGVPSPLATGDLEAAVGEQAAHRGLDLVHPLVPRLAIDDQRAVLADLTVRDVYRRELPQGIVAVRLVFHVLPLPGFFVRAAHERFDSSVPAHIADPSDLYWHAVGLKPIHFGQLIPVK